MVWTVAAMAGGPKTQIDSGLGLDTRGPENPGERR
jgi:hypothetical protein